MDTQHLSTAERLALLKLARASAPMQAPATLSPIEPVDRSGPLPLSFAQQRLWFIEQLGNQGSAYHLRSPVRLRGELDRAALARALDALVARHEALRTVFAQVDGVPRQRIAPAGESRFHLVEHDLAGEADPQAELARLTAEEGRARFDLERGPLIRGRLIRVAADDHVLLLTMHHIVSDDWSMGVLTRELSALYAAFRRGEPDPLPALPVQYADYAVWQRRRVEGEVLQAQAEYWTRTLAGAPELLELPADHPRPALQEHAGARFGVVLDEALTAGLRALSQRHGTTLFMTLLAGWAAVLGRLAGQDDVVVGTPMAGRGRREIEELIGFFVNTLALRVDLSGSPTVAGLLRRVRERVLEAQKHQDIPFEQVVELAAPARSLSHTPLFQALFAWQNAPRGDGLSLPGLELGGVGPASQEVLSKFDLSLSLREAGDRIAGNVTYATALFERETVERWVGYLRRVLEEMAADESRPVERLALMPAGERARLVEEWNRTDAEYPADSCVHERFEARARRAPDAVAVVHEGEHLTYAELNRRANRLAHHLRGLGVGPDVRVGICVERGPAMLAGVLAVLKAGGAFVPFDPAFPAERLRFMLEDSAPSVVLTQASLAGLLEGEGVPLLLLDRDLPDAGVPETDPERAGLLPEHLAYVIYTSGSTGRPKGVMVPHRGVVNSVEAFREVYRIVPGARVLFFAPLYFDASVLDIFPTFAAGATLVVGSEAELVPGDALIGMLRRHQVTHAKFTPSVLAALPDADLPELGAVMSGGDACPAEVVERWGQGRRFYNGCGATEVSVRTMVIETADFTRPPPIGRAVANVRLYVVDELLQPVPVGVAGEMCVGGIQVTRGYQNRPELTADRFVADPFGTGPGARMYRTGDRVRWLPDGNIEFLGRTDFQVKVRGFRIELGEIEARLAEHPGVREAVVLARGDGPGGGGEKRLVAYYVGEGGAVGAESLRAHLGERLPEYMVPAAYVRLEHFPLTPAGKLDRAALPAPEGDAYVVREYEEPVGETEQALAEIWAEVLGAERVGRRDDFFDLGGHSLLAVQVISRVRQVLEAEVELGTLFTRPVLADFARGLETAARAALPPIEPAAREGRVPLSFAQQRLWFLEQLGTLGSAYHVSKRQRLRGELDRGALARALDAIVARHESLRTVFAQTDGVPEQRIAPADAGFPLREHDLEGHADAKAELGRLVAEEAHAPFDLARGPLIRGRLVRLAADDHLLLVTMHHIVSDGWSMGVLTRELGALYAAFRGGAPDPLPALPVQYADYAIWQRRWVDGAVLQAQADYWKATLAGAPELLELPTDRPRPAQMELAGGQLRVVLDEELTAALKALSRRRGTTLFMTLLAGWAVVLSRLSGQDDVVVGTPMAGRGRREIEGLIGFFVNTLALRLDLSGAPTAAAVLARVKERTLAAQHHQDIPFEQVVELVDPARSLAHSPLFQVLFAWQNTPRAGGLSLPGLRPAGGAGASPAEAPADAPAEAQATRDLALSLHEADGRIAGNVLYARALFDRETVERHVGYLRRVLHELAADESRPVERIPLMPESERARVLEEWNQTAAAYPAGSCIHELFQEQAERRPHAVAVVFGDERWSYGELNARANRLAHRLRSLGVGPDARVAICVERSPAMMVGLLGVLKAGGAYVPLDPGYPAERLAFMLEDSAPAVLLTQRHIRERLPLKGTPALCLDPEWEELSRLGTEAPDPGVRADNAAYVLYTSGSTGQPKG
ncbi:MAG TPA: amino acid adenylation domain-containing protein, partial [Longimicrobium sp.]|nr:amino acid adenylation domain-containing protein [Longimicrobium sp.]